MDTTTDGSAVIGHGRAEVTMRGWLKDGHPRRYYPSALYSPPGLTRSTRLTRPIAAAAIDSAQAQRAAARRSLKLRTAPRLLSVRADICAAMVQRGYLQSCASTRQRWETILPPVMAAPMAMECQILSVKGNHRRIRPNAAKAAMEPHHAIIGARWCCRADPKHQQPNCKS